MISRNYQMAHITSTNSDVLPKAYAAGRVLRKGRSVIASAHRATKSDASRVCLRK